jgi:nucleotide-binding universal stress UspA family protein
MNFKHILVPVDFSTFSQSTVDYAVFIAEKYNAEITLFHAVVLFREDVDDEEHLEAMEKVIRKKEKDRGKKLKAHCADAAKCGVTVHHDMVRGFSASDVILEYIDKHDFDMVIMGTHGHTGLKKWVYGSTAERIVRLSPIPVLTLHQDLKRRTLKSVLIPVDFSDYSKSAVQFGIRMARDFQARCIFLHAVEQDAHPAFYAISTGSIFEENPDLPKRIKKNMIQFTGVPESEADYVIVEDKAHKAIKRFAEEKDTDLIIMATRGLSGLEHFLLGSTAERVVAIAPCPVLTVERSV